MPMLASVLPKPVVMASTIESRSWPATMPVTTDAARSAMKASRRVARTMTTIVAIPAMSARMSCRSIRSSAVRPTQSASRGLIRSDSR